MKEYELTVLIHPDLEADLETPLAKVREIITTAGGTITKEDNWGKKKLQYQINREDFAVYVYMDLELPADAPLKVGDMIGSGISHPCTTFDKWQLIAEVDDAYTVVGAIRTFF